MKWVVKSSVKWWASEGNKIISTFFFNLIQKGLLARRNNKGEWMLFLKFRQLLKSRGYSNWHMLYTTITKNVSLQL